MTPVTSERRLARKSRGARAGGRPGRGSWTSGCSRPCAPHPAGHVLALELREEAGYDYAIPIGRAQTTSQPSLIALMLEALELQPDDSVLEIGTGLGYETALIARLSRHVFSVERISELAEAACRNLEVAGVSNAEVVTGDGTLGLPGSGPFDAIVVAAAFFERAATACRPATAWRPARHAGGKRRGRPRNGVRGENGRRACRARVLCRCQVRAASRRKRLPGALGPSATQNGPRPLHVRTRAGPGLWAGSTTRRSPRLLWPTSSSASFTTTMSPAGRKPTAWAG